MSMKPVDASVIVDQQNLSGNSMPMDITRPKKYWQGITAGITGTLSSIEVFVPWYFSTENEPIEVRSVLWIGTRWHSIPAILHVIGSTSILLDFSHHNISLTAGDRFYLDLLAENINWPRHYVTEFGYSRTDTYAGGRLQVNGEFYPGDLYFQTFMDVPDQVPEPSTLFLFGFGILGLARCGRSKNRV